MPALGTGPPHCIPVVLGVSAVDPVPCSAIGSVAVTSVFSEEGVGGGRICAATSVAADVWTLERNCVWLVRVKQVCNRFCQGWRVPSRFEEGGWGVHTRSSSVSITPAMEGKEASAKRKLKQTHTKAEGGCNSAICTRTYLGRKVQYTKVVLCSSVNAESRRTIADIIYC